MKISELISKLETLKAEHGDIQIFQHGHSMMVTLREPDVGLREVTQELNNRVVWDTKELVPMGGKFLWL